MGAETSGVGVGAGAGISERRIHVEVGEDRGEQVWEKRSGEVGVSVGVGAGGGGVGVGGGGKGGGGGSRRWWGRIICGRRKMLSGRFGRRRRRRRGRVGVGGGGGGAHARANLPVHLRVRGACVGNVS